MLPNPRYKLESPSGFHLISEPFSGEPGDAPLGARGPFGVQPRLSCSGRIATMTFVGSIRHGLVGAIALAHHGLLVPPAYRKAQVRQVRSLPSLRFVQLRAQGWPGASL
jgi:hypothetical protein